MSHSGLSVVVPVRGRVAETRRLLASLHTAIGECPEPAEVIVVDDSDPPDARSHQQTCARFQARYLRGPRPVGAKRNAGVAAARYDLIQFIDSDCLASPDLLRRQVTSLRRAGPDVAAVAGPTYVQGVDTTLSRVLSRSRRLNSAFEWPAQARRVGWATTSNLAVRRTAFAAVNGFAERPLTVVGGEDVDLGLRLSDAGYAIICDPAAVVTHDRSSIESLRTVVRRLVTYGKSGQWLLHLHPGRGRPKLNRISALAVTAVTGLAAVPVSAGFSLLLVPVVGLVLLVLDARERVAADPPRPGTLVESAACALLDWAFDLGEFLAAWQLRRPDRLFTGFGWTDDDAFVWERTPAYRYGG